MITKIFTVYDSKAEAYMLPFFMNSKGEAIRAFTESANDATHQFCKYAEDFTLFELGQYDDSNGFIAMHPAPISMGVALEFSKNRSAKVPAFEVPNLAGR